MNVFAIKINVKQITAVNSILIDFELLSVFSSMANITPDHNPFKYSSLTVVFFRLVLINLYLFLVFVIKIISCVLETKINVFGNFSKAAKGTFATMFFILK